MIATNKGYTSRNNFFLVYIDSCLKVGNYHKDKPHNVVAATADNKALRA